MRFGLFKLFQFFCYTLDRFIWEPSFWLVISSIIIAISEFESMFKREFYVTRKERFYKDMILLVWSIITIYYKWFRPFRGVKF